MNRTSSACRRALVVLGCAVVAAAAAFATVASLPPSFLAAAGVSVVARSGSSDAWWDSGAQRRSALIALVHDPAIAGSILARFDANLPAEMRSPERLLAAVEAGAGHGDVIEVGVRARDRELSARLADAWAEAYVERTNAVQPFSDGKTVSERLADSLVEARERLRIAEAAVAAHEAGSRSAELRARRDRAQALLSRLAAERAEIVGDICADARHERTREEEPAVEGGAIGEIRGLLARLGARKASEGREVAPASRLRAAPGGAGTTEALAAADADFAALLSEDAAAWEPLCVRIAGEVDELSNRIAAGEAEARRLERARDEAEAACGRIARRLDEARVAEASLPPLVRFIRPATPPPRPEGPSPMWTAACAAAIGALLALALTAAPSAATPPPPRVFDVMP